MVGARLHERVGLVHVAAHEIDDDGEPGADRERNAPAPGLELLRRQQQLLQDEQHQHGEELAADQRHVLEARVEAAVLGMRHLGKIGGAGAVLAAQAQPLHQAGDEQDERGRDADAGVGGRDRDHQRADAHQQHRDGQRQAAPVAVGEMAEQPAADGPHQEADGEDRGRLQELRGLALGGKEGAGEIERERRVGVEVEPFDEIAGGADEDRLQAARGVGEVGGRHRTRRFAGGPLCPCRLLDLSWLSAPYARRASASRGFPPAAPASACRSRP